MVQSGLSISSQQIGLNRSYRQQEPEQQTPPLSTQKKGVLTPGDESPKCRK